MKTLRQILDEVSKHTLTNYAIKASSDRLKRAETARKDRFAHNSSSPEERSKNMPALRDRHEKFKHKDKKRSEGVTKAVNAIAKGKR